MANKMATWEYAANIAGGYIMGYTDNELITKKEAVNIGCDVSGSYSDNQCVSKLSLSKHDPYTYVTVDVEVCYFCGKYGSSNLASIYVRTLGKYPHVCYPIKATLLTNWGEISNSCIGPGANMPKTQSYNGEVSFRHINVEYQIDPTDETNKIKYRYSTTYTKWDKPQG